MGHNIRFHQALAARLSFPYTLILAALAELNIIKVKIKKTLLKNEKDLHTHPAF
jgi:hypothetical protein